MNGQTTKALKRAYLNAVKKRNAKASKYTWRLFKKFFLGLSHKYKGKILKPFYTRSGDKVNIATGNSITYVD